VPEKNVRPNGVLNLKLERLSLDDPDYWSFRGNAKRDHGHGLMQYPAMMVPQMVRALMREICETEHNIERVGDPFVGSGTVLTETTLRGLDFCGGDINPLAILLCRVKAGPVYPEALAERADELIARVCADRSTAIDAGFEGIDKWFVPATQQMLSRIRRAIRYEAGLWARRFFWVAMAETVRLCSNSRTSAYKLHIRTAESIAARDVDSQLIFDKVLRGNIRRFASLAEALRANRNLVRGHYTGQVSLTLGDARAPLQTRSTVENACDLIITSPPYGDNATTVPYGQYSYLPLQWIDLADIGPEVDPNCLSTTHEIDRRSLGGSRRITPETTETLCTRSPNLAATLKLLADEPKDRAGRVLAFVRDLSDCMPRVSAMLRPGGVMVWVLGNRRVGGQSIPLDAILCDLLKGGGASLISEIRRRIPSKRMAVRNSVAETMAKETILVFRKARDYAYIR
jgi:hypothetical protein